jgi:4-hydroxybenzoate polyprenyltransferase
MGFYTFKKGGWFMAQKHITFSAVAPLMFLAFSAGLQLFASSLYLHVKINFSLFVFLILLVEGVYLLNRLVDDDSIAYPERTAYFRDRKWLFLIAAGSLLTPIVILLATNSYKPLPVFVIGAIIGTLYTIKLVPLPLFTQNKIVWISLKQIPIVKSLIVAALWSGSALTAVILANDTKLFFRMDILLLFITVFITCMNSTINCDIRDESADKMKNIVTIPTLLGKNGTSILLSLLNVTALGIILFVYSHGYTKGLISGFCALCIMWAWAMQLPLYVKKLQGISRGIQEMLFDSQILLYGIGLCTVGLVCSF